MKTGLEERAALSIAETCRLLGMSRGALSRAIAKGDIPSIRVGGRILIPKAALGRLLLDNQEQPHTTAA